MELLIGDVIANAARVNPRGLAATLDDRALTFAELDEMSNRFAHAFAAIGIRRADRVAWWGDTNLDALPLFGALAKLGAVFAPLNARATVGETLPVVEYARPRLLLCAPTHVEQADAIADSLAVPLAHLGPGPGIDVAAASAVAAATTPAASGVSERDAHVIFFTSGSTGRPKGVVLSHRSNWLRTYVGATTSSGGGGVVCMFPLFHMAGWTIALGAWQGRRTVHFVRTPDADTLLATAAHHHAERLYCIPAVWARVLEQPSVARDLASIREADTGTSATPPELLRAIKDALPHTATRVFYGSTEAGPGLQLADADLFRKPGSVGTPQPGVGVRLSADGEVCLRSPFLMDGYFDDPAASRAAIRDGWYHTGDLGVIDDEGYVSVVGRARDVIRTGGETVAPIEVETVVATHPAVAECAVVGMPDAQWGEVVTAVVVPVAGLHAPDVGDLRAHCAGHLAPFKHPRRVEIVESLPRTQPTGQVQRTLIVERLNARGG